MGAYLQIMKGTWAEYMIYRLNFVLWRVRVVMQLLVTYFLWWALFSQRETLFGYTQSAILTYILLSSLVRTFVLGPTTMDIGGLINQGNLSNYLLRPMSFFRYYMARDSADKLINAAFAVVETVLLFLILRPPIFIQTNIPVLLLAFLAVFLAMILYFFFSILLGFLGFWTPDIWGPRFLSFVLMEFFTGSLFPLDILPKPLFTLSQMLPFSYFIYFPLKIYLGQLSLGTILQGFGIASLWVGGLWYITFAVWRRGLRVYTAEGR